jgi:hypothetical protein
MCRRDMALEGTGVRIHKRPSRSRSSGTRISLLRPIHSRHHSEPYTAQMAILPSSTMVETTTTTEWTAPTGYAALIAIGQGKAAGLRGFPPNFIPPNFFPGYEPVSRGNTLVLVCIVSISITLFVAVARLITRRIVSGWLGMDDWMVFPAMVRLPIVE